MVGFRGSRVTDNTFPEDSRPYLLSVANAGLSLLLFLVGLDTDAEVIRRNGRISPTVSLAGMAIHKSYVLEM